MGKVISLRTRRNIEAQGFLGLDELQIAQLDGWLRFSPAVCMIWTAVGTYQASVRVLAALVPMALLGGLMKNHPFDIFYNFGLRFFTGGPEIPAYGSPRRFGCLMAALLLSIAATSFTAGLFMPGYLLGGMMVVVAGINVTTGFCVPSHLYGKLSRKPARVGTTRPVEG